MNYLKEMFSPFGIIILIVGIVLLTLVFYDENPTSFPWIIPVIVVSAPLLYAFRMEQHLPKNKKSLHLFDLNSPIKILLFMVITLLIPVVLLLIYLNS
jgi:4-hydroxybenzoate polyprenyltransferase